MLTILIIALIPLSQSIICPDNYSDCPTDTTCCLLSSGSYGCCPLSSAQCCSNGLLCCPKGTKCNDNEGTCDYELTQDKQNSFITKIKSKDLNEKTELMRIKSGVKVHDIVCPGGQYECPDGDTCCLMGGQTWECCPLPNAVCCSDGLHCCPGGTQCDLIHNKCLQSHPNEFNVLNSVGQKGKIELIRIKTTKQTTTIHSSNTETPETDSVKQLMVFTFSGLVLLVVILVAVILCVAYKINAKLLRPRNPYRKL